MASGVTIYMGDSDYDDMVIVIIIISQTITPRGGYDLRIVLKENIAPESNIALNPQFLKELFLLM